MFSRADDGQVKSYDPYSLNGMTIGVFEQAKEKIRRLNFYFDFHQLNCTIKYYKYQDMVDGTLYLYLLNGDVGLLLGNEKDLFLR